MTERLFTIANNLTYARIIISIIATGLILLDDLKLLMVAVILIAFSELTDMLDGYIARRDNCVTQIGKLLDPLSDSISRFMYYFAFGYQELFPIWLVLILFIRDIIVAYIRTYISLSGVAMGARQSGKIKALVQFIGQYILLFMLVFLLISKGQTLSEEYVIVMTLIGTVMTFIFLKSLRVHGKYLLFSITGYIAFLIPFYTVNKISIGFDPVYSLTIMVGVVLVTLWSLLDYLNGFIVVLKGADR